MAESTFIDKVRFSLRINTSTNTSLNTEIQRYIDAAVKNLTNTTDIRTFDIDSADALLQDCVIAYCHYRYEKDPVRQAAYKEVFDDLKTQLCLSSDYSTLGGTT